MGTDDPAAGDEPEGVEARGIAPRPRADAEVVPDLAFFAACSIFVTVLADISSLWVLSRASMSGPLSRTLGAMSSLRAAPLGEGSRPFSLWSARTPMISPTAQERYLA